MTDRLRNAANAHASTLRSRLGSVGVVAAGSAITQVLNVGSLPILTRLFPPDALGGFSTVQSFMGLAALVALAGLDLLILQAPDEQQVERVTRASIRWASLVGVACAVTLILSPLGGSEVDSVGSSLVVGVGVIALAIVLIWRGRGLFRHRFRSVAYAAVVQVVVSRLFQLTAGWAGYGSGSLIAGHVVGAVVGLLVLMHGDRLGPRVGEPPPLRWWRSVGRHGLFITPAVFFGAAARDVPLFLVAYYFGLGEAGLFAIAFRVIQLPSSVLSTAVGDVFHLEGADRSSDPASLARLTTRTVATMFAIYAPLSLCLALGLKVLGVPILGPDWEGVGDIALVMTLAVTPSVAVAPATRVFVLMQRQSEGMVANLGLFVVTGGAFIAATWVGAGLLLALFVMGVARCILYLAMFWRIRVIAGLPPRVEG
ncbi:MAG: oligosaccharide flippase family protein [Actinomycetota bacterium]